MAKQIIVTQNDYGIELETQFVDDKKKPLDITDYDVWVKVIYDDKTIDTILAGHKDSANGIVYIALEKEHLKNVGLHTVVWSVVDEDEHVTAQEDLYYFVKETKVNSDNNDSDNNDNEDIIEDDKITIVLDKLNEISEEIKDIEIFNANTSNEINDLKKYDLELKTEIPNIITRVSDLEELKDKFDNNIEVIVSSLDELEEALNNTEQGTTIKILPGYYKPLKTYKIPSYTVIKGIGNVEFDCSSTSLNCVFTNKLTGQESGYNGSSNIVINNIIFDGKGTVHNVSPVAFGHSKNIIIKNCSFKGFNSWHNIELNGCCDCYVLFNTFEDYGNVSKNNATEVIQIDYMGNSLQYPWIANYDDTACSNINIEFNTFKDIKTTTACIGTHSYKEGVIPSNIIIRNNHLDNVETFYYLLGSKNSIIENNTAINIGTFVNIGNGAGNSMDGVIINNNNCTCGDFKEDRRFIYGIDVDKHSYNIIITNNIIKNYTKHAIGGTFSDGVCSNNIIQGCGRHGIYMYGWFNFTVMGNRIYQFSHESTAYSGIRYGGNPAIQTKNCIIVGNFAESVEAGTNQTNNITANNL